MNEARLEACITCGTQHDVEPYYYEITYSPLWVWLFVFLCGPLPTLLLYRMMRQGHDVEAFFCGRCWARAKYAGYVWPGLVILTILFIVVGFYFSAVYKADGVISPASSAENRIKVIQTHEMPSRVGDNIRK